MTPRIPLLAVMLLSSALVAERAAATLARAVTFDEKVEQAEAIVLGRCVDARSEWDPSHRWIVTYSKFTVEETLKGSAPADLTLVTPGGTVGGIHQESIGIRPFREGGENVLFVKNTPSGPTVLYFDQGTYDVATDARGSKMVVPVTTGAVLIDAQRGMAVAAEPARPLDSFRSEVKDSIRRGGPKKMEMLREQPPKEASLWDALMNFRALVILALIGLAISGWQLFKR